MAERERRREGPRQAVFRDRPDATELDVLDPERIVDVRREELDGPRCYLLRRLLAPSECRRLIAAAEARGFDLAGLAIGDDDYRVNRQARDNLRVIVDDRALAAGLWARARAHIDARHEGARVVGLNWRLRIYKYEVGQAFRPHYDVRTPLPGVGETRMSLVIYLNEGCDGGETTFYERKPRSARRGSGRRRKLDNNVRFAVRPEVGAALVFDHLLLHEGAEVRAGVKYAVRSDVIYSR
ncbi:MAG: 2OG-Fe(II) oxygenase [Nannocystaceae bacterium]